MANILVVDDSPVDRMLLRNYAEKIAGYSVIEAESGEDALFKIREWDIDLVVTDLLMPGMDGLELVNKVRDSYPDLPVILATAHGSEAVATQALEAGASGYIPKSDMQNVIVPTIRNVLAILNSQRSYAQLIDCSQEVTFKFDLANDPSLFPPLVDLCDKMLSGMSPLDRIQRLRVVIAVEQALQNALFRGNLEIEDWVKVPFGEEGPSNELFQLMNHRLKDPAIAKRRIKVAIKINRDHFECQIHDQGRGFDHASKGELNSATTGRGLVLINTFMDSVQFNPVGNQVVMSRNWDSNTDQTLHEVSGNNQIAQTESAENAAHYGTLVSKNSGRSIPLTNTRLVIGSGRECNLRLKNDAIPQYFCVLTFVNNHWVIQSLDEKSTVSINGRPVKSLRLNSGDIIALAKNDYEIRYRSEAKV
jgi:CheY-like chemotaxis protein